MKCINCQYIHQYKIGKRNFYDCYHPQIYKTGKKIYAKDVKKSPIWCPKK